MNPLFIGGMGVALFADLPVQAQNNSGMELRARPSGDDVEIVVEGVGANPVLQQRIIGSQWQGRLTTNGNPGIRTGTASISLPELGIQRFTLEGEGKSYLLKFDGIAGYLPQDAFVSADGKNLILSFSKKSDAINSSARLNLNSPARVPQASYVPPLRPRAEAPPLGDIAVGTMLLQNRSFVKASGPDVTLIFNNAPAKDAILSVARLGGYGYVYVQDSGIDEATVDESPSVTMAFRDETYSRALNSLLLASGLQAKLEGRTLIVGKSVSGKTFAPQFSKVFRLNQASSGSAADYLASLGAQISKVNVTSITSGESEDSGGSSINNDLSVSNSSLTSVETYGASVGPLRGLTGTTDSRLETITLVGDSQLIAIAEGYLKQIDLRQRQVAVKVQILNVDLLNDKSINSSFSAKIGNTFIVSDSGRAYMNFGEYRPGNKDGVGLLSEGARYVKSGEYQAGIPQVQDQAVFSPPLVKKQREEISTTVDSAGNATQSSELVDVLVDGQPVYVPSSNPSAQASLTPQYDMNGRPIYVSGKDPGRFSHPNNSIYGYLDAVIESSSAKTLAQPTLLVQEGQESEVQTGTSVITSVTTTENSNGSTQFQYSRQNAGLNLKVKVSKIDDNGFVSLNVKPEISVPIPAGESNGVDIFNISGRSLSSGSIRLRDRQTLVLTGVIQDIDSEKATKWPILGDLPLIGQFFRNSGSSRSKNELVILVTPMIVSDELGGSYGYGYKPSTSEARQLLSGS